MPTATWNDKVIAQATDEQAEIVEGNVYFPLDAVDPTCLRPSELHTVCPWKGTASYYDVVVDGKTNRDAAWFYPEPKTAASQIKDRVAFWRGITVN